MGTEIVPVEGPTREEVHLKKIQETARIKDERFELGKEFAILIAEGSMPAYKAYAQVFDVTDEVAQKKATKLKHGKWMQELIRYYQFDDDLEYNTETKTVIARLMTIIKDPRASAREVTEATKALQPYIKQQVQKQQVTVDVVDSTGVFDNKMAKMQQAISQLAGQNKMVSPEGEIIDVEPML